MHLDYYERSMRTVIGIPHAMSTHLVAQVPQIMNEKINNEP